jgi:hypothetical protein
MRSLKKLMLTSTGVALSGFLVSACAKDPLTAPAPPSLKPHAGLMETVNMKVEEGIVPATSAYKSGATKEARVKRKRSGYMVSSS